MEFNISQLIESIDSTKALEKRISKLVNLYEEDKKFLLANGKLYEEVFYKSSLPNMFLNLALLDIPYKNVEVVILAQDVIRFTFETKKTTIKIIACITDDTITWSASSKRTKFDLNIPVEEAGLHELIKTML